MVLRACIIVLLVMVSSEEIQDYPERLSFRVANGVGDVNGSFPYIVAVVKEWQANGENHSLRWCTGSLLTSEWVLSTAHSLHPALSSIQYGDMTISIEQTLERSPIIEMISHPLYQRTNKIWRKNIKLHNERSNDIALIRVRPVRLPEYARLSAVDYKTLPGVAVLYAGYGVTFVGELNSIGQTKHNTRPLQIGEGVVSLCPEDRQSLRSFICVSPKCTDPQTALRGDYGGPLFYDAKIVAVMKATVGRSYIITHTVWTPISLHLSWIHQVVTRKNVTTEP